MGSGCRTSIFVKNMFNCFPLTCIALVELLGEKTYTPSATTVLYAQFGLLIPSNDYSVTCSEYVTKL